MNVVADALSRASAVSAVLTPSIDYAQLAADQQKSAEITAYQTACTNLVIQPVQFQGCTILCDVSTGTPRPLVPKEWTKRVFDAIHGL